jgi:hypothetical protein
MQFIHNDLGQRKRGEIVEITLTSGANVRLMDSSNFSSYKNGRRHSYIGGLAKRSHKVTDPFIRPLAYCCRYAGIKGSTRLLFAFFQGFFLKFRIGR